MTRIVDKADFIWLNGEFVKWDDANVHVLTHGLHYGSGVFEGMRAYETERGPAIFRHDDHLARLTHSARLFFMDIPFSRQELRAATQELIRRNSFSACYIRPIVFRGYGEMGLLPLKAPVVVAIAVWRWGAYLGDDGVERGIRVKVSSWRRPSPAGLIPQAKATGQYLNSILAKIEATHGGYDEAVLLDERDQVAEGTGENIFIVLDGELITPPRTAAILDGVTRRSVIRIAADLGHPVREREIARSELYEAQEVFLTGTAAEITPVREVDDRPVGPPGDVTRSIQRRYLAACRGELPEYIEWLDFVEQPANVS